MQEPETSIIPARPRGTAILLLNCQDRPGIVSAISGFLFRHGANILHAEQHQDNEAEFFFMRVEFSLDAFELDRPAFTRGFSPIADTFGIHWRLAYSEDRTAIAIFVSRYRHCLADLLYRHQAGELPCEIRLIVGNHEEAASLAGFYNIPFHFIPCPPDGKVDAERRQLDVLETAGVELVVLARYMQILSPAFVDRYPRRIINVHHSFLPAFTGARPYHAAFERGVKLIGATSHYVTGDLDEGPIIEQDVTRVSHRDQVSDLTDRGRDLERLVLSRAVRWHLEHRILCYGNKTVVFR